MPEKPNRTVRPIQLTYVIDWIDCSYNNYNNCFSGRLRLLHPYRFHTVLKA